MVRCLFCHRASSASAQFWRLQGTELQSTLGRSLGELHSTASLLRCSVDDLASMGASSAPSTATSVPSTGPTAVSSKSASPAPRLPPKTTVLVKASRSRQASEHQGRDVDKRRKTDPPGMVVDSQLLVHRPIKTTTPWTSFKHGHGCDEKKEQKQEQRSPALSLAAASFPPMDVAAPSLRPMDQDAAVLFILKSEMPVERLVAATFARFAFASKGSSRRLFVQS